MIILSKTLAESYCFISNVPRHQFLNQKHGWGFTLGQWHPQRIVSESFFGLGGGATVRACEDHYGNFVWATEFSNVHAKWYFEEPKLMIDGEEWAGSEAYFQAMKSAGTPDHQQVKRLMKCATPMEAYRIGRRHRLRDHWEAIKVNVMRKAVHAKFTQHKNLMELLLSTGNHPLVQVKPGDDFWGTGSNNQGQNMLGELLMELRTHIRNGTVHQFLR